jgi:hypothetical protein
LESPNKNNGAWRTRAATVDTTDDVALTIGDDIVGHFGTTLTGFLQNGVGQLYLTMGAMTGMVCHTPKTSSGRLFNWAFMTWNMIVIGKNNVFLQFVLPELILQSRWLPASYTANLASILTQVKKIDTGIADMGEITAKGLPVCIAQATAYGNWLMVESRWAGSVKFVPVAGSAGCIAGVKSGLCSGAIVTDAAAKFLLSQASDGGGQEASNCGLRTAGDIFWKV